MSQLAEAFLLTWHNSFLTGQPNGDVRKVTYQEIGARLENRMARYLCNLSVEGLPKFSSMGKVKKGSGGGGHSVQEDGLIKTSCGPRG